MDVLFFTSVVLKCGAQTHHTRQCINIVYIESEKLFLNLGGSDYWCCTFNDIWQTDFFVYIWLVHLYFEKSQVSE